MNGRRIFKWAAGAMIVTGLIHLVGHFAPPQLDTPEKEELLRLMNSLLFTMDPWFDRTIMDIFNAFSLYLSVMLLTLGGVNLLLSTVDLSDAKLKAIIGINLSGMMMMLALSFYYAFSIPIVLFLIVVGLLGVSFWKVKEV